MNNKQVVFTKINTAEFLDSEKKEPGENEVCVKTEFSTISPGTEKANITGDPNVSAGGPSAVIFPRCLGYSSSGTVVSKGKNVSGVDIGDRVVVFWGTHSKYNTVSQDNVVKISDEVSFEEAAMSFITTFPMAAIRKTRLEIGESAIVMGMGILGLAALQLLRAAGAAPIIAVDPVAEKREKALQCGADYALDPYKSDFIETVKQLTDGGAKVAIEVTGVGKALDSVLDCMARYGRVALLGCTRNSDFTIDYYHKVHGPGITLVGAHASARPQTESSNGWWTQRDDIHTLMKLTEMGRLSLASMIDEVHSPMEAVEVYDRLANEKAFPLVQFDWRKMS